MPDMRHIPHFTTALLASSSRLPAARKILLLLATALTVLHAGGCKDATHRPRPGIAEERQ